MGRGSDVNSKESKGIFSLDDGNFIVQHNKLVESRYNLSLQEKRVILWLTSQINQEDEEFKPYTLDIKKFAEMINISNDRLYPQMMAITKKLMQRIMTINLLDSEETLQVAWLSSARYQHKKGYVVLKFNPELKSYLLQLKKEFTVIKLPEIMSVSSFSAIRVYELLKQYESIGERIINLDELKKNCGIKDNEYPLFGNFKQRVLEIAKREINTKTDIFVDFEPIKESRKVVSIKFLIKANNKNKKTEFEKNQFKKSFIIEKELRSGNALIEGIMEFGFSKMMSKRFLQKESEEVIRNALKSVTIQIERGNVKNAKAMFIVAINERWDPKIFLDRKAKKTPYLPRSTHKD